MLICTSSVSPFQMAVFVLLSIRMPVDWILNGIILPVWMSPCCNEFCLDIFPYSFPGLLASVKTYEDICFSLSTVIITKSFVLQSSSQSHTPTLSACFVVQVNPSRRAGLSLLSMWYRSTLLAVLSYPCCYCHVLLVARENGWCVH